MLDALEGLSGSDVSDSESSQEEEPQEQPAKKAKKQLTIEDLEATGYKAGPSVLFMKPPAEEGPTDWRW